MQKNKPLISVVTIVFNGVNDIEHTIKSVISQSFPSVEYIVIDGGSTDGTVELIKKHDTCIDKWISEPDKGLYDAMNKGLSLCSGEYVVFMNSGDIFYGSDSLSVVAHSIKSHTGSVCAFYGDHIVIYHKTGKKKHFTPPSKITNFLYGMPFCHQTLYVKRDLLLLNKFDCQLKIGADFKQVVQLSCQINFSYIDAILAVVSNGGVSDTRRIRSVMERVNILKDLRLLSCRIRLFYFFELINQSLREGVKNIYGYIKQRP